LHEIINATGDLICRPNILKSEQIPVCVKYDEALFVRKTLGQRGWRQNFNDFGKIGEALQSDYVTTWQGSLT
jgi:hypothetical protein